MAAYLHSLHLACSTALAAVLVLSSCLCSLQAGEYRAAGNEFQLYVMLMRFAGCEHSHLLTLAASFGEKVQGTADIGLRAQACY